MFASPLGSAYTWAPRMHRVPLLSAVGSYPHIMWSGTLGTLTAELRTHLEHLRALRSSDNRLVANFQSLSQELTLMLQQRELLGRPLHASRQQQLGVSQLTSTGIEVRERNATGHCDNSHLAVKAREVETDIHRVSLSELQQTLQTDLDVGMTGEEALKRQQTVGINMLTPPPVPTMFVLLLREFFSGFGPILWVAALLCFLAWRPFGDPPDPVNLGLAIIIIVVIVLSSSFAFYQARKSIGIISAFSRILPSFAVVRRDGRERRVLATDLVPGDIVHIKIGDKVPADIRLIRCDGIQVNNSALTGESEPVECGVVSNSANLLESTNVCFYSSLVIQGAAVGVVINTGDRTVLGHVSALTKTDAGQRTNLQREIRRFVIIICTLAITTAIVCFIAWMSWLRVDHYTFLPTSSFLTNVIGLVVAYLPTGLPLSLSLVLTFVAKRMYVQHILVKTLSIVEDFNSVSIILSDKTGTLTLNQLTATNAMWGHEGKLSIPTAIDENDPILESSEFLHPVFQLLLRAVLLCNNVEIQHVDHLQLLPSESTVTGDAVDVSLYQLGLKCRRDLQVERAKHPRIKILPFNSKIKLMGTINQQDSTDKSQLLVFCKGAPEYILQRCMNWINDRGVELPMLEADKTLLTVRQEEMGHSGYRVIAVCQQQITYYGDSVDLVIPTTGYTFLGLVSFIDPPRPGVAASIAKSSRAGIRVAMVTGDHPTTATAIAKQVSIIKPNMKLDKCVARRGEQGWTVHITRSGVHLCTHIISLPDKSLDVDRPLQSLFNMESVASTNTPTSIHSASDDAHGHSLTEDTDVSECAILVTGGDMKNFDMVLWDFVLRHSAVVFARTSPEQKLKIVSECQQRGEVVAVTGDGTNDAPALKRADVGVAMQSGTEVAQEASDMILLDNNFVSIVTAIETGRLVSDNLKKVTLYLLPAGSWSELLPILANFFLGLPLPLSAFLMIVICMLTDMCPSLALVKEVPERDIMKRKPVVRNSSHLVDWRLLFHAYALIGMIESFSAFLCWFWYFSEQGLPASALFLAFDSYSDGYHGFSQDQLDDMMYTGQSIFFVSLVITQFANLLSSRTRYVSFFQQNPFTRRARNLWLFAAMLVSSLIAILITQVGFFNDVFHTRPVPVRYVMPALGFGGFLFLFDEVRKGWIQRYPQSIAAQMAW